MTSYTDDATESGRALSQSGHGDGQGRRKRAKYATRACQYCQRRKIRCEGGVPCTPCTNRNIECQRSKHDEADDNHEDNESSGQPPEFNVSGQNGAQDHVVAMLLQRLAQVEEQLETVKGPSSNARYSSKPRDDVNMRSLPTSENTDQDPSSGPRRRSSRTANNPIWDDRSAFAGETSARYNMNQMEDRLDQMGVGRPSRASSPPTESLTPPLQSTTPEPGSSHLRAEWRRHRDIHMLLRSHGISFDREKWEAWLVSFFAEVHHLYPLVHPPSVWEEYSHIWSPSPIAQGASPDTAEYDMDLKLAQIFILLAVGRCTTALRSAQDGRHSAGWSFYSVATELIGDVMDLCGNRASPLLQLQTLCLMVVYLFRLDANERAQNVLALAVSHAHSLGINRSASIAKMTHFTNEMYRRVWWSIFVLDRRLCIETGRPFFILDVNTDTELPTSVSDSWLSSYRSSKKTAADLQLDIEREARSNAVPQIMYLIAMVEYSRVVGKTWSAVYAAPEKVEKSLDAVRIDYVELLLDRWRDSLPPVLLYEGGREDEVVGLGLPRIVKLQSFSLYLRYNYMRLMIRKPIRRPTEDDPERSFQCIHLANTIIEAFLTAPPSWGILRFPWLPYLLGATMASLSILLTEPTLRPTYSAATTAAAKLLKQACNESWVSGKTARTIARLHAYVSSVLPSTQDTIPDASAIPRPSMAPYYTQDSDTASAAAAMHFTPPSQTHHQHQHLALASPPHLIPGQMSPPSTHRGSSIPLSNPSPCASIPGTHTSSTKSGIPMPLPLPQQQQQQQQPRHTLLPTTAQDMNWPDFNVEVGDFAFEQAIGAAARFAEPMAGLGGEDMGMGIGGWNAGAGMWLERLIGFGGEGMG